MQKTHESTGKGVANSDPEQLGEYKHKRPGPFVWFTLQVAITAINTRQQETMTRRVDAAKQVTHKGLIGSGRLTGMV